MNSLARRCDFRYFSCLYYSYSKRLCSRVHATFCHFFSLHYYFLSDYLFGNETEALAFAGSSKWETTDIKEIAEKIAALPKANSKRERTVVITQGHNPTIVVHEGKTHEYPVHLIEPDHIVDTNGAGDAFVGGFYSQLILGQPLHVSCRISA